MQNSTKDLKGNTIVATDGDIGKVDDFYFDDKSWTIRYLVADTGNWLVGRKVLLSPIAIGKADFSSGRFNVTLTKKQVEDSPSIDTDKPVSRQHEISYHDYYGYPYYWTGSELWGMYPLPNAADGLVRPPPDAQPPSSQDADLVAATDAHAARRAARSARREPARCRNRCG